MSVIGTRLPPSLGEKVRRVCQELGRTPSQWLRELVQREIEGRELFSLEQLASDLERNAEFLQLLLMLSVVTYKMLCLVAAHQGSPAWRIEQLDQKLWEGFSEDILRKRLLPLGTMRELNWVVSEIEELKMEMHRG